MAFKGKKITEEHKRKVSLSLTGIKRSAETREKMRLAKLGKGNPNFGKKFSIETRKKMSDFQKSLVLKGIHHLGDGTLTELHLSIRNTLEYRLWREAVFKRDGYRCIWCGSNKSGTLNADHIKPFSLFPELRFAIDNGRTLCETCHRTTETYGVKLKKHGK